MNVLIVDDQPEGLLALEVSLQPLGVNLVKARSGPDACRQLLGGKEFAVILLDINMPEMDGYETAALIHGRPSCRHMPIIFLTASHEEEVRVQEGYAVGAVDYVFKPFDAEILRAKVSVFLGLARRAQRARELAEEQAQQLERLREQKHALEDQLAMLATFPATARQPVEHITRMSEALFDDYLDLLDEAGRGTLTQLQESAHRLAQLLATLPVQLPAGSL